MKRYRDMTPEERDTHDNEKIVRHEARLKQEIIDRELDIRVAKNIFGAIEVKHEYLLVDCDIIDTHEDVLCMRHDVGDNHFWWEPLPDYTKSLDKAWLVKEEMSSRGFCCFKLNGDYSYIYDATFIHQDDHETKYTGQAETAAEAIVLAALEATFFRKLGEKK